MANAKKCDICGCYYDVPNVNYATIFDDCQNTNMVRILKRKTDKPNIAHDVMQFDSCERCTQDVLDYILTKKADSERT